MHKIFEIFEHLPLLPALDSFTICLDSHQQARRLITALTAAPNLTTLIFRIVFNSDYDGWILGTLDTTLKSIFPWGAPSGVASESMKSALTRNFPLIRQIRFHFCAYRASEMHYRRGLRREMERQLKSQVKRTRADVEEYLQVAWFDEDYNPVTYSKTNGKPPWKVFRNSGDEEPETEASESDNSHCESDSSDEEASDCESDEEGSDCESDKPDEGSDE